MIDQPTTIQFIDGQAPLETHGERTVGDPAAYEEAITRLRSENERLHGELAKAGISVPAPRTQVYQGLKTDMYPLIWCGICDAAKPLLTDEMPADDRNDHAAMDLMCSDCRLVIATLHAPSITSPVADLARLTALIAKVEQAWMTAKEEPPSSLAETLARAIVGDVTSQLDQARAHIARLTLPIDEPPTDDELAAREWLKVLFPSHQQSARSPLPGQIGQPN